MFQWGTRTYVMGIVNVTPDSFSGDGVAAEGEDDPIERAVTQARRFAEEGADVLDIGGESTRPGSRPVTAAEEKSRVIPVIASIRAALPQSVISVDTYRADVAALALDAGADWVNDVWGLRMDPAMAELIAGRGCPIIIMHNRSKPKDAVQCGHGLVGFARHMGCGRGIARAGIGPDQRSAAAERDRGERHQHLPDTRPRWYE